METKVKVRCDHCGKWVQKNLGHANRARKQKARMFCNQKCFGLFWRDNKTVKQKKAEKAVYDLAYRKKNRKRLKKIHAEYFRKDYAANPEKYREIRKKRMSKHVEYCRQDSYRRKKKKYDEQRVAALKYGDYAEAAIILKKLESLIDRQQARIDKDCHNKTKKRKQLWKNLQPSTLKMPSGKRYLVLKKGKSSTQTPMLSPRKGGKSSERRTPK